jgi:hypothetical protein
VAGSHEHSNEPSLSTKDGTDCLFSSYGGLCSIDLFNVPVPKYSHILSPLKVK